MLNGAQSDLLASWLDQTRPQQSKEEEKDENGSGKKTIVFPTPVDLHLLPVDCKFFISQRGAFFLFQCGVIKG